MAITKRVDNLNGMHRLRGKGTAWATKYSDGYTLFSPDEEGIVAGALTEHEARSALLAIDGGVPVSTVKRVFA